MKSSFSDLCVKYDDIRNVDRMAAVQASVGGGADLSVVFGNSSGAFAGGVGVGRLDVGGVLLGLVGGVLVLLSCLHRQQLS